MSAQAESLKMVYCRHPDLSHCCKEKHVATACGSEHTLGTVGLLTASGT